MKLIRGVLVGTPDIKMWKWSSFTKIDNFLSIEVFQ